MSGNFNIKNYCQVVSNDEGDRFVGIKMNSDSMKVYFPLGYQLPEKEKEMRREIRNLFQVLDKFTDKSERVLQKEKHSRIKSVEFPVNAYMEVINYYFSNSGKYYVETEKIYSNGVTGKIDWARTIKKKPGLIQKTESGSNIVFTEFQVRSSEFNDNKLITQINKYCVYESFSKIGWIYGAYIPEKPRFLIDLKTSAAMINHKLATTFNDKEKKLFKAMKSILEYLGENPNSDQCSFGTEKFEIVWERMIDRVFGISNKEDYFPRAKWMLKYGRTKEKRPLQPDTIMIYDGNHYILDAKYYRYGVYPNHVEKELLPNASSINKQITYGEYLWENKKINDGNIFNAFVMPFNMQDNIFGFDKPFGNVGEATGDWRSNEKNFEKIQGIVLDTRFLMHNYMRNQGIVQQMLAEEIEGF